MEYPELTWRKVHVTAWPFYLCDWAAVICGLALLRRSQILAEIGWCWGIGGTLQGLVYPTSLSYDLPNHPRPRQAVAEFAVGTIESYCSQAKRLQGTPAAFINQHALPADVDEVCELIALHPDTVGLRE